MIVTFDARGQRQRAALVPAWIMRKKLGQAPQRGSVMRAIDHRSGDVDSAEGRRRNEAA